MKTRKNHGIALFVSLCLSMFVLAGCGNSNISNNAGNTSDNAGNTSEEEVSSEMENGSENQETDDIDNTDDAESEDLQDIELVAGTYPDGSSPEFSDTRLRLTIDGQEVVIRMYDNSAADEFLKRLPLENLSFYDLSGIEKPMELQSGEEEFSLGDETPGYDPVTGDMVIYRPWGNFTIFYGDFRHSDELVPLGQVESGLDIVAGQTDDFTGTIELYENE